MHVCEGIGILVQVHKAWVEKLRFQFFLILAGYLTLGKSFILSESHFITSRRIIIISIQLMTFSFV